MDALQDLATFAASHRIRGRSYKRNSMLKPLDIILNELDRCPNTKDDNEIKLLTVAARDSFMSIYSVSPKECAKMPSIITLTCFLMVC